MGGVAEEGDSALFRIRLEISLKQRFQLFADAVAQVSFQDF